MPTPVVVRAVEVLLLAAALLAVTGRWPRLAGAAVALLYGEWMVVAMSYGKVDHDRFAFLVCLAVLPTVGRAGWRDTARSEAAGVAIRAVQVAVVATYFLSSVAKVRFGGWEWVNSAVLMVAVLRRGTALGHLLLAHPTLLLLTQWGIVGFELLSPLVLLLRDPRWRLAAVLFFLSFHLVTFATISIIFLPHVVCLAAFLRPERAFDVLRVRRTARGLDPPPAVAPGTTG